MPQEVARGRLRVYLGAAPGVGKTFAMLSEGRRRRERGTDVVIGVVETHGRPRTLEASEGFEVVPRRRIEYRGAVLEEMDLDAIIARAPEVVLVDELAHTNAPGSRQAKRWQDVEDLLAAGIDVISTVNIQHLESLGDVVTEITGVVQRETIPDHVVRRADQVEIVDMAPEALRRRMAHGNVYGPDKIDAALSRYFRVGNLTALRELALLWLADKVEDGLQQYRQQQGISDVWETRERIVVALTGGPEGGTLVRRAARIAERAAGAELLAVHVARSDGLKGVKPELVEQQRQLVESLGGTYHQVSNDDVALAVLEFARRVNATQVVLGTSRRSRWARLLNGEEIAARVIRESGDIDVHLVTHEASQDGGRALRIKGPGRREVRGAVAAILVLPALTAALAASRGTINYSSEILIYLLAVVGLSVIGGRLIGVASAVAASLLLNWYFTAPQYTFTITEPNNLIALATFLVVSSTTAIAVDLAVSRERQAALAARESAILTALSGDVLRAPGQPEVILDRLVTTFGLRAAALVDALSGEVVQFRPEGASVSALGDKQALRIDAGSRRSLVVVADRDLAQEQRLLSAFAVTAGSAERTSELAQRAAEAEPLAEADRVRTALLRAVSHDLRTPLAAAKAAVTGLRSSQAALSDQDRADLLESAEVSLDRLGGMVSDLLDVSRLQAGVVALTPRECAVNDVVTAALQGVSEEVVVKVPVELPAVLADPVILERVLANLVTNAVTHGRSGFPVTITASSLEGRVEVRVIDRGSGIAASLHDDAFAPFQRTGDRNDIPGTGLGLALVKGFTEAMGGSVRLEDTPGGGLTAVLDLPAVAEAVDASLQDHSITRTSP